MTARWALILLIAACRCVATLTEQPAGSLMRKCPYIVHVEKMIADVLGAFWRNTFLCETQLLFYIAIVLIQESTTFGSYIMSILSFAELHGVLAAFQLETKQNLWNSVRLLL